jgi:hypothetical protein
MFDTRAAKMALAIAVTSVAIAVAVAPLLSLNAYAVKEEQPAECTQGPDPTDCPGNSGGQNPNRDQIECSVTAGTNEKPVSGQEKKVC